MILWQTWRIWLLPGLSGAPSANIDRDAKSKPTNTWFSDVTTSLAKSPKATVEVFSNYNPGSGQLDVRVRATFGTNTTGTYTLGAILY